MNKLYDHTQKMKKKIMKINSLKYQLNMEMNGAWAPMNKTSETQWQ